MEKRAAMGKNPYVWSSGEAFGGEGLLDSEGFLREGHELGPDLQSKNIYDGTVFGLPPEGVPDVRAAGAVFDVRARRARFHSRLRAGARGNKRSKRMLFMRHRRAPPARSAGALGKEFAVGVGGEMRASFAAGGATLKSEGHSTQGEGGKRSRWGMKRCEGRTFGAAASQTQAYSTAKGFSRGAMS